MITSIQKYSIHDGDGIRTTVFFKGCPLRCIWCHNPETQEFVKQMFYDKERCIGCLQCERSCPHNAIICHDGKVETDPTKCECCGTCLDYCVLNLREITGTCYSLEELLEHLRKDMMFYEQSGGGVTLSGGEVMSIDMDYLVTLVRMLYKDGISVNIDTCGYTQYENFEKILPYVDTFLYDLKIMDLEKHKRYIGVDNKLILDNLRRLSDNGARIYIRIPVILEVNGNKKDMEDIIRWLLENNIHVAQVNLLPYHNISSSKYDRLSKTYIGTHLHAPSEEQMFQIADQFKASGFYKIKIGG